MTNRILSPLPGWNVRGYSYGELQPDGQRHPGADLYVGYGDDDLLLPVVCFADGTVVELRHWDGHEYGLGNIALVEHTLFASPNGPGSPGSPSDQHSPDNPAGPRSVKLWSAYAHLDS